MGLLDNIGNLLQGSGKRAMPYELLPGEREQYRTPGSVVSGGLSTVGGDIVVTNQRLLFAPLNVTDVAALLGAGLERAGAPQQGTAVVGWLADRVSNAAVACLVVSIENGRNRSLLSPPTVVIAGSDGRSFELGVTASRLSPNVSQENDEARARLIAAVKSHLKARSLGPDAWIDASSVRQIDGVAPKARPQIGAQTTSAALTESEIDASMGAEEDQNGIRIFMPMARARSERARFDDRLLGTWAVPELGSITLADGGRLTGAMQLFGALPVGPVAGQWWVDGVPDALVLNFVCVQRDESVRIEFATSWPLQISHVSPDHLVVSHDEDGLVLTRLP
jgi:hypothetical protein